MELRTFVIPRKNVNRIIIKLIVDEDLDEQIIFDNSEELEIEALLCKRSSFDNSISNPIKPRPIDHADYNTYSDFPKPLSKDDIIYLKENGCSIAKFKFNKKFSLILDMNIPTHAAKIFADIMSKHLIYQIAEYIEKAYSKTLPIAMKDSGNSIKKE